MDGRRPPLFCQSPGNEEELPTTATGGKEGERGEEEGKDKGGLKVGNIELLKEEMKVKRVYGMKDLGELN